MNSTNPTIFVEIGDVIKVPPFANCQAVVLSSFLILIRTGSSALRIHIQTQDFPEVHVAVNHPSYENEGDLVISMSDLLLEYILGGTTRNPSFSIVNPKQG